MPGLPNAANESRAALSGNNQLIRIEAAVFGGPGSAQLPSKNVFANTTIPSEKEASNAIL
jgi:hypothetical protein